MAALPLRMALLAMPCPHGQRECLQEWGKTLPAVEGLGWDLPPSSSNMHATDSTLTMPSQRPQE